MSGEGGGEPAGECEGFGAGLGEGVRGIHSAGGERWGTDVLMPPRSQREAMAGAVVRRGPWGGGLCRFLGSVGATHLVLQVEFSGCGVMSWAVKLTKTSTEYIWGSLHPKSYPK